MVAFKLTQEMEDEGFSGGTINCSPLGHTFNVGEELEKGDGMIVTDDDALANVLRGYGALEAVPEEDIPEDVRLVEVPGQGEIQQAEGMPWTPQTPDAAGEEEIPAEHADVAPTVEGELSQGEIVSDPDKGEGPDDSDKVSSPSWSGTNQL